MTLTEYNICVDNYADNIYRFILNITMDEDMVKDFMQESFDKLWQKVDDISLEKSRLYLFATAYQIMIDEIKKNEFEDVKFNNKSDNSESLELKEVVEKALEQLSVIQKSVVLLRDYEGYSYGEIGEITGLKESQVKVHIYRARLAMNSFIEKLNKVL